MVHCTYGGIIAEDHFDVGMSAGFGLCADDKDDDVIYRLAIVEQLMEFDVFASLTLEMRQAERPALRAAEEAVNASSLAVRSPAYGITRVVRNDPPDATAPLPSGVAGLPAPDLARSQSRPTVGMATVGSERRRFLAIRLQYDAVPHTQDSPLLSCTHLTAA